MLSLRSRRGAELTAACACLQNHTSPSEVGIIFSQLKPRLAIATHLSVSSYSILPIISAIRATYPVGPLAVAQDFSAWDVTPQSIVQRQVTLPFTCMHARTHVLQSSCQLTAMWSAPCKRVMSFLCHTQFVPVSSIDGYMFAGVAPASYELETRENGSWPRPETVSLPGVTLKVDPAVLAALAGEDNSTVCSS
jgi:hypothetical protein